MNRKDLGFELQRVTRQSLASLEQTDRYYLDYVMSRLLDNMSSTPQAFFHIDDSELKDYLSYAMRHYFLSEKRKSHIIFLNKYTSSLPYDLPYNNTTLIIDIAPDTPDLYVESLDRLVESCYNKNIKTIVLACTKYDYEYLDNFALYDDYDCIFSEHEMRLVQSSLQVDDEINLYSLTAGMPTLLKPWVIAHEDTYLLDNGEMYQASVYKCIEWYMREDLPSEVIKNRVQLLLVGKSEYELFSATQLNNPDNLASPFVVINGCSIGCAGWDDIQPYRKYFENHQDILYEHEGSISTILETLYQKKKWPELSRALSIIPSNDITAKYVSYIPFEVINCGYCSLIEKASLFEHSLSTPGRLSLRMGQAAIAGNIVDLETCLSDYCALDSSDIRIQYQARAIIDSYRILRGENVELEVNEEIDSSFLKLLNMHNSVLNLVSQGNFETAYQIVLLQHNTFDNSFIGEMLGLDLVLLSLFVADDSWDNLQDNFHPAIEMLSSSGINSINSFIPVIKDCIDCIFNNEINTFTLERAISTAQCREYSWLASCMLIFSTAYNLKIKNLLKAYTQAQLLMQLVNNCDSDYLNCISQILYFLTKEKLGEDSSIPYQDLKYPSSAEGEVLAAIVWYLAGIRGSNNKVYPANPVGMWWFIRYLEQIDEPLVAHVLNKLNPVWVHDYKYYRLRFESLAKNIKEACEMSKVEDKLIQERNILHIDIMGSVEIRSSGKVIEEEDWTRKAAKMLLLYLAIAENHRLSRADLQELLWPDKDYISARGNLYTALSSLKRTIGYNEQLRPYIKCNEGYISLNPECVYIDSDAFSLIATKMIDSSCDPEVILGEQLIGAYHTGLFVPIGDESGLFHARREYFQALYLEALMNLAELSLRMGRPRQTVRCTKEILSIDDRREDAFLLFIHGLHSMGRRAEVVTAYNIYSKTLINKYGIAISSTTRDMYTEIIQDDSRPDEVFDAG